MLYYGENEPWFNIQGLYSNFWWSYAVKTPMLFKFPSLDIDKSTELLNEQQRELNHVGDINRKACCDDLCRFLPDSKYNPLTVYVDGVRRTAKRYDEYRAVLSKLDQYKYPDVSKIGKPHADGNRNSGELSMGYKIKRYYKQFGVKKTVRRVFEKLSGK